MCSDYYDDHGDDDYYDNQMYYAQTHRNVSVTIASLPLQKPSTIVRRQESPKLDDDIPPDFDKPWSKSDVVLRFTDSEGKELHANKVMLSVFSPYFDALFSGRFGDKDVNSVDMKCDYNAMKEILLNIHHIDCSYEGLKKHDHLMLKEMYYIGDYYNFPHIRRLCLKQMTEQPSVHMAVIAAGLGLQDTLMNILMRLPDVREFLGRKEVAYLFNKKEVRSLFEHIFGMPFTEFAPDYVLPTPLNLEGIAVEVQNPRIDLTKPWELADVAISTKNSMDRLLYANQSIINAVSTKFKNLAFTPPLLEAEGRLISSVMVDADYATMKEILTIINHCDIDYQGIPRVLHPAMLHSMCRVAAVDQLDILMIRELCIASLMKQMSVDSLEVFADLDISLTSISLPISKWLEWISRKDGHLSYRKGDEVVVLTPSQDEPRFAASLVLWLFDQISNHLIIN